MSDFRIEKDSLGDIKVPKNALYAAQTQRAVENFPISGIPIPRAMIKALGLIKQKAAEVNLDLELLDENKSKAIRKAAGEVIEGKYDDQFPIDIFQTGSGTSSNRNANEVIANLATQYAGEKVHPNDHVNMGQSSNDVIPTAIHLSAYMETEEVLIPGLKHLLDVLEKKAAKYELFSQFITFPFLRFKPNKTSQAKPPKRQKWAILWALLCSKGWPRRILSILFMVANSIVPAA